MREPLYVTFGNELKYQITEDTLIAYLENATIKFPLPEASSVLLEDFASIDSVNPQVLDTVKSRLISIGFKEPSALTMASVLIQVAKTQGVSPMEYFSLNEASLKLAVDTYSTINSLRPSGNRIGLTTPIQNKRSRPRQLIQP